LCGSEIVVNLANKISPNTKGDHLFKMVSVNVFGLNNILQAMIESGVKSLIQPTFHTFGEAIKSLQESRKDYILSQLAADLICESYVKAYSMNVERVVVPLFLPEKSSLSNLELAKETGFQTYNNLVLSSLGLKNANLKSCSDACSILMDSIERYISTHH